MNEEKVYLVWLVFDDGYAWHSDSYEHLLEIFSSKEKAEDFCKNNSDKINHDNGDYIITKPKDNIIINNKKPITIQSIGYGKYCLRIRERILY